MLSPAASLSVLALALVTLTGVEARSEAHVPVAHHHKGPKVYDTPIINGRKYYYANIGLGEPPEQSVIVSSVYDRLLIIPRADTSCCSIPDRPIRS